MKETGTDKQKQRKTGTVTDNNIFLEVMIIDILLPDLKE